MPEVGVCPVEAIQLALWVIVWSTPMELIVEDGQLLLKVAAIDGDGTGTVMDNCC